VGLPADQPSINQRAGSVALMIRTAFEQIETLQAFLAGQQDSALVALGYTAGEVAILKSAISDLDLLRRIYQGAATQAALKDFTVFPHQLTGCV
jgi:hypothetical protein